MITKANAVLRRFTAIQPQAPAHSDVHAQMREAILNAQFRPGEFVSLRTLATAFQVSIMPIREAASRLAAEGCLEIVNRKGLRIPTLDKRQAMEILAMRVLLEGLAAEQAAAVIRTDELKHLVSLERRILSAVKTQALRDVLSLNMEFHLAIYRAARNQTLFDLIQILLLRYAPSFAVTLERAQGGRALESLFVDTHSALLDALHERDGRAACKALRDDIRTGSKMHWGDGLAV